MTKDICDQIENDGKCIEVKNKILHILASTVFVCRVFQEIS